ncbi:MAG TPA: hypothetical protein VMA09_20900 [Candidatus Binataceae bacterium]|nr:hypothetical protein [Candidatus Binataceae bacterium]
MKPPAKNRWPLDTRLFAIALGLWACRLLIHAFLDAGELGLGDSLMLLAGLKLFGDAARFALLVEASIFFVLAWGILTEQRWAMLLALGVAADIVLSHLLFVAFNLNNPAKLSSVRTKAAEGPALVAVTLYLWIRSKALVFHWPSKSLAESGRAPEKNS